MVQAIFLADPICIKNPETERWDDPGGFPVPISLGSTRKASLDMRQRMLNQEFHQLGRTPTPEQVKHFCDELVKSHGITDERLAAAVVAVGLRYARGIGGQFIDLVDDILDVVDLALGNAEVTAKGEHNRLTEESGA